MVLNYNELEIFFHIVHFPYDSLALVEKLLIQAQKRGMFIAMVAHPFDWQRLWYEFQWASS